MSAEGQFPVVMRGYNRAEVDSAIAGLQRELMDANTERSAQSQEIKRLGSLLEVFENDASSSDKPTYAGLGAKLEMVLRTAEEQSTQLISASDIEAQRILSEARAEAERLVSAAHTEADALIAKPGVRHGALNLVTADFRNQPHSHGDGEHSHAHPHPHGHYRPRS